MCFRNGAKQHHVAKQFKETILSQAKDGNCHKIHNPVYTKFYNDEDSKIAKEVAEDDLKELDDTWAVHEKKMHMAKVLQNFKAEDYSIRQARRDQAALEVQGDRRVNEKEFQEHLFRTKDKETNRLKDIETLKGFWKNQCNELDSNRKAFRQSHKDYEDAIKLYEDINEDNFEKHAEDLIFEEKARGRDTYPMRKAKVAMNLGRGAAIMNMDNFDHKIYANMTDIYYKPIDSRNRLSINWNPDDKSREDKTI